MIVKCVNSACFKLSQLWPPLCPMYWLPETCWKMLSFHFANEEATLPNRYSSRQWAKDPA